MRTSFFFFSSRRRHTRLQGDWSSDVCSSDLERTVAYESAGPAARKRKHTNWVDAATGSACRGGRQPPRRSCFSDRKRGGEGKRGDFGGRRIIKKKKKKYRRCVVVL